MFRAEALGNSYARCVLCSPPNISAFLLGFDEAIRSAIFTSRTSLLVPSKSVTLSRAIYRWKELWWLAWKLLELAQSDDEKSRYMIGVPTDYLDNVHGFI